jgi:hypothetical protein
VLPSSSVTTSAWSSVVGPARKPRGATVEASLFSEPMPARPLPAALVSWSAFMTLISIITCPYCGRAAKELMPSNACQLFYNCKQCGARLKPKPGDCCVFCSYGSVPCPRYSALERLVNARAPLPAALVYRRRRRLFCRQGQQQPTADIHLLRGRCRPPILREAIDPQCRATDRSRHCQATRAISEGLICLTKIKVLPSRQSLSFFGGN